MYKIIGELESLGDSGEAIGRILKRKNVHGKVFDKPILDRLNKIMDLVQKGYDVMITNMKNPDLRPDIILQIQGSMPILHQQTAI